MTKYVLLAVVAFALTSYSATYEVYICYSKGAKRYHLDKACTGLSNCKAEIKKVALEDAKSSGRTLCGYED